MATQAGDKRFGASLGVWIFLILALLILLTAGGALVTASVLGERSARQAVMRDLSASAAAQSFLRQQRHRQLELISRIFATDPILTSYLAEAAQSGDPVSILDSIEVYQNMLGFDLAIVLDKEGRVLARSDDREAVGGDLSGSPFVAAAQAQQEALGVWQQGEDLYHAAALPLARNFELVGYVVVALAINDAVARQVQRISGTDTVMLTNSPVGHSVAASTLAPAAAAELISSLRLKGEVLRQVTQRGETAEQIEVSLQGRPWLAFMAPLSDAAETPVGAAVSLAPLDERLAAFRTIQRLLIGLGLASLAIGLIFARILARRTLGPIGRLTAAVEATAGGNLEVELPPGGGVVARLRDLLAGLFDHQREKQALEHSVSYLSRYLPEPAKSAALQSPQAHKMALVAVELRRFAKAKTGYDADENVGRLARDLRRIAAAASAQKGRLDAVFGHRALAVFEGDNAALPAMCAATEILQVLSERENVFDEPEPPVVALASGPVVTGTAVVGDRPSPVVAGLPVQQLESMLREATPGEIYISKALGNELAETIRRTGAKVRAQRGILSPQPLYVLSGEQASLLTGVEPRKKAETTEFPGERRSLAALRPGTVLGDRFEITSELGSGRLGTIFKARDRDLGDLVTLKILKPEVVADGARFEHLKRVIQRARGIAHPNVLEVLDFAEIDGLPYVSLEFVRGLTLRYVLEQGRRLSVTAGLRVARQIGWGLQAAHEDNLLHRGLKPENVLIDSQGEVKVMDFGLSTPDDAGARYLAPEQLAGQEVGPATDVYSYGVVLYELLTGEVPYAGGSADEIRHLHLMQDPAPPSTLCEEISPPLERLIDRCLVKVAGERYGSVAEMLGELRDLRA